MYIDLTLSLHAMTQTCDAFNDDLRDLSRLGHFGTHIDVYLKSKIPLNYMNSDGCMFDVRHVQHRDITLADFDSSTIEPTNTVLFRTDTMHQHKYGTREYYKSHPQLSDEVIQYLIKKKVTFIGIDAAGIKRAPDHIPTDKLCERHGVYIIENITNLAMLAEQDCDHFKLTVLWIEFPEQTGLPCRLVATCNETTDLWHNNMTASLKGHRIDC